MNEDLIKNFSTDYFFPSNAYKKITIFWKKKSENSGSKSFHTVVETQHQEASLLVILHITILLNFLKTRDILIIVRHALLFSIFLIFFF